MYCSQKHMKGMLESSQNLVSVGTNNTTRHHNHYTTYHAATTLTTRHPDPHRLLTHTPPTQPLTHHAPTHPRRASNTTHVPTQASCPTQTSQFLTVIHFLLSSTSHALHPKSPSLFLSFRTIHILQDILRTHPHHNIPHRLSPNTSPWTHYTLHPPTPTHLHT